MITETLGQKQRRFALMVAKLINKACEMGYEVTLGEWWESQGGTWGGRFRDGNHYGLEHDGAK